MTTYEATDASTDHMMWYTIVLNGSLTAGSRGIVNSLNSLSVEPRLTSGCVVFSSRLRMASVAHAFFITWTQRSKEGEREGEGERERGRVGDRQRGRARETGRRRRERRG